MKVVSIIGYGGIGSGVVGGIDGVPGWQLGRVLTRRVVPGLAANTCDPGAFFDHPSDLIIDAAGPDALRALGAQALMHAPLWSVGAVALAEPAFRKRMAQVSLHSGHPLRLFACGMAGMPLKAKELQVIMRGPEITHGWEGPLAQAVARWPDRLNTAVACALNGPGLAATRLVMESGSSVHEIEIAASCNGITWHRRIRFDGAATPHPVAQMLLTELGREARGWQSV